jgi:hypothetical protein
MVQRTIQDLAAGYGRSADAIAMIPMVYVHVTDQPAGTDRQPFQGSITQVTEDVAELAEATPSKETIFLFQGMASGKELVDTSCAVLQALSEARLCDNED